MSGVPTLILVAAVMILGQGSHAFASENSDKSLQMLRASLDLVAKSAPTDKRFEVPASDPSALVGLKRKEIELGLGEPTLICKSNRVAGCRKIGDWVYSFYKLPGGSPGGGPELSFQFNADDVCTSVEWTHSQ